MITGNGDAVELRHVLRGVLENITDDAHGHIRRVDVSVTNHELFQNVVLDRPGHDGLIHTLLDAGLDEEGKDRQNGAVHRHGNGHLIQGNPREQDVHVQHGANGNARFSHVAEDAGIVRVVAAVRRQVKGDGKAFLSGGQVATVERVGFFRRGESGVLPDRPGTENVHGGIRPPQAGGNAAGEIKMGHVIVLIMIVEGTHLDMLHRRVDDVVIIPMSFLREAFFPLRFALRRRGFQFHLSEIRIQCHQSIIPFFFCRNRRIS